MSTILILSCLAALPLSLILVGWSSRASQRDATSSRRVLHRAIVSHVVAFSAVFVGVLFWAAGSVYGDQAKTADKEIAKVARSGLTVGDGLGMLSVALATGLSVLGAAYAVGIVGSAALGAIAEKPELFGRTLIFVGLAEGLAIYGLIVSILILGRLA